MKKKIAILHFYLKKKKLIFMATASEYFRILNFRASPVLNHPTERKNIGEITFMIYIN